MFYAIVGQDAEGSLAKRAAARPAHLERLQHLQDEGRLLLAGPFPAIDAIDPGARTITVAHLGDGNLHFTAYPTRDDAVLKDKVLEAIEDIVADLGGSFSAEHGVGLSKLPSMARRKDAVALDLMRTLKQALDPQALMNPGKVIPG